MAELKSTRITGALSGTSATFSGNIGVGGGTPSIFTAYSIASFGSLSTTTNGITIASTTAGNGIIEFADGVTGNQAYRGYIQYAHTTDSLIFATAGSDRLTIASTGAATFSSSVTALSVNVVYNNAITNSTTDGVTLATYTTGASNELLQLAITLTNNNTTTQVRCNINYTTDNNNAVSLTAIATSPLNAFGEGQAVVALNVKNGTTLTVVLVATAGPINWSSRIAITKIL